MIKVPWNPLNFWVLHNLFLFSFEKSCQKMFSLHYPFYLLFSQRPLYFIIQNKRRNLTQLTVFTGVPIDAHADWDDKFFSNEFHYKYVTINVERYFKSAASETKIKIRSFGCWTIILNLYQNWGYYKDFEISNILEDKAEEWFRNVNICIVYWIVFERCRYPP